jgi:hypothetical protein
MSPSPTSSPPSAGSWPSWTTNHAMPSSSITKPVAARGATRDTAMSSTSGWGARTSWFAARRSMVAKGPPRSTGGGTRTTSTLSDPKRRPPCRGVRGRGPRCDCTHVASGFPMDGVGDDALGPLSLRFNRGRERHAGRSGAHASSEMGTVTSFATNQLPSCAGGSLRPSRKAKPQRGRGIRDDSSRFVGEGSAPARRGNGGGDQSLARARRI